MHERLVELRKALGLSQREFCKPLGIHQATYAPLETSKREIRDAYVNLICRVYHVSATWLRTGEGDMFIDRADVMIDELLTIYDALSPQLRQFLLRQARELQDLQGDTK